KIFSCSLAKTSVDTKYCCGNVFAPTVKVSAVFRNVGVSVVGIRLRRYELGKQETRKVPLNMPCGTLRIQFPNSVAAPGFVVSRINLFVFVVTFRAGSPTDHGRLA